MSTPLGLRVRRCALLPLLLTTEHPSVSVQSQNCSEKYNYCSVSVWYIFFSWLLFYSVNKVHIEPAGATYDSALCPPFFFLPQHRVLREFLLILLKIKVHKVVEKNQIIGMR